MTPRGWPASAGRRTAEAREWVSKALVFCAELPVRPHILLSAIWRDATVPQSRAFRLLWPGARLRAGGETGQALVEEALILALIVVLGAGALTVLQGHVSDAIGSMASGFGSFDPPARNGK